ncbi:hypothetical protein HDV00_001489 [Rhizophlyctis rosea]|nr:hypothetical protein HDV00_001489 [Rhizophlyctis rosea]
MLTLGITTLSDTQFEKFQDAQPAVCACCKRISEYNTRSGPRARLGPLPVRLMCLRTRQVVVTSELCGYCRLEAQKYFCISHVWGDISYSEDLTPYGCTWSAPVDNPTKISTLLTTLQRAVPWCKWLWMDVLCIDQSSGSRDAETQVTAMRQYYRNGGGTIALLSHEEGIDALGYFKEMSEIAARGLVKWGGGHAGWTHASRHDARVVEELFGGKKGKKRLQACIDFLRDPWLQRVWTLQEFVLPIDLYFLSWPTSENTSREYGLVNNFDVHDVFEVFRKATMGGTEWPGGFDDDLWNGCHNFMGCQLMRKMETVTATQAIYFSKGRQCSRDQDRVYGLLGLLSEVDDFPISYTDDLDTIYRRLLSHITPRSALALMRTSGPHLKQIGLTWAPQSMDNWIVTDDELSALCDPELLGGEGVRITNARGVKGRLVFRETFKKSKAKDDPDFTSWVSFNIGWDRAWVCDVEGKGVEVVCLSGVYGDEEEEGGDNGEEEDGAEDAEEGGEDGEDDQEAQGDEEDGEKEGEGGDVGQEENDNEDEENEGEDVEDNEKLEGDDEEADSSWEEVEQSDMLPPTSWVSTTGNKIPDGAVQAGQEGNGNPLYIARVYHEGGLHVGKAGRHLPDGCHIAYGGAEITLDEYEILVDSKNAQKWLSKQEKTEPEDGDGDDDNEDVDDDDGSEDNTLPFPSSWSKGEKLVIWTFRKNRCDVMGGVLLEALGGAKGTYKYLGPVIGSWKGCWEDAERFESLVIV